MLILDILRAFRFVRNYIKRFPGRCASLLAFLGRKLGVLWRLWLGKLGTFRSLKPVGPSFPGNGERSYSVSDSSPVLREYVVAAANVPASASQPSLHERIEMQPATMAQSPIPNNSLSVDQPLLHTFNPTHSLDGRNTANRSFGNLSTHSRASDRLSIITKHLRESLGGSARAGHPSPKAPYHQFGRGPDPSPPTEQLPRPSPINRYYIHHQHSHPQIVTADIPSHAQAGDRVSPSQQSRPRLTPAAEIPEIPETPARSRPYTPRNDSTPSIIQPIPILASASSAGPLPLHPSPSYSPVYHPPIRIPPDNWIPRAQDTAGDDRLSIFLPPPHELADLIRVPEGPYATAATPEDGSPAVVDPTASPRSPAASPSSLSYRHELLSPPPIPEKQRTESSTSMVLDLRIQNPSTDSLLITPSTNPEISVEEPMAMHLLIHSPPVSPTMERFKTDSQITASSATTDIFLPEGRFVQLIISDQIPRYTKNIKMYVASAIICIRSLHWLADPAREK